MEGVASAMLSSNSHEVLDPSVISDGDGGEIRALCPMILGLGR
jgi:hypothetical protein